MFHDVSSRGRIGSSRNINGSSCIVSKVERTVRNLLKFPKSPEISGNSDFKLICPISAHPKMISIATRWLAVAKCLAFPLRI